MQFNKYFIAGGAGFIGSHFVDVLLTNKSIKKVTVYDNLSSGKIENCQAHFMDSRFKLIQDDIKNQDNLIQAMQGHDVVLHLASNPDISRSSIDPSIDFTQGVFLTYNILEAARKTKTKRIIYASGSGVYGEIAAEIYENQHSMYPISTYGASKLAGEAYIYSYCHMFDLSACIFRFANVVGPRQTHGVGYDFIHKLKQDPCKLQILGDGLQKKSYIYINDVITAVLLANTVLKQLYEVYNVATHDAITVKEVADITINNMNLKDPVAINFTGGDRGWRGDVPVVKLNTDKICSLGWKCKRNSYEAVSDSILSMLNTSFAFS